MATAVLVRVNRLLNDREERDGDCLRRFADSHDETAFAELVLRHGPAVYGICRRALGDHQLAEDAFQAVFVILARKAATIRTPDAVGGWLFGVAWHVAARGVAMRRRIRKERATEILPECLTEATEPDDAPAILESEIAKLPEALRAAVVLCEIEGLSRSAAATRLGIAEGTLSSRLANARKRLATPPWRGPAMGRACTTRTSTRTNSTNRRSKARKSCFAIRTTTPRPKIPCV